MDLDSIKLKWNEIDAMPPVISEDKIRQMLNNKSKSALNRLIRLETIFLVTSTLCIFFPFIHNYIFSEKLGYTFALKVFYISVCIFFIFWQLFKLRHLKRMNFDQQDVLTSFKQILRYRRYIISEIFGGFVFAILFTFFFGMNIITLIPEQGKMFFVIYIIFITAIILLILLIFYKLTYQKQIQKIKNAFDEIKDLETN